MPHLPLDDGRRRTTTTDGRDGRTEDDDDDGTDDGRTQDRTEDDDDDGTDDGRRRRRATDDGRRRRTDGLHFSLILNILIDIGTKILKQKCFGSKTNVFNTHSNFPPAIEFQISSSIRISYSRPLFRSFLEKLHAALDLQVGRPGNKTEQKKRKLHRYKHFLFVHST